MDFLQALDLIRENVSEVAGTEVHLTQALGRCLSTDLISRYDNPPFCLSKWDGFALNSKDTWGSTEENPVKLTMISSSSIFAGSRDGIVLKRGACVPIMTGAEIPRNADAVIKIEDSQIEKGSIIIKEPIASGSGVISKGSVWKRGNIIVRKGTFISPYYLHLVAELGYDHIVVYKRPRIAFLAIGDELVPPGESLPSAGRFAGGQYFLMGIAKRFGCDVVDLGIVADDFASIVEKIRGTSGVDMIVTIGGTGKGVKDLIRLVWKQLGAKFLFSSLNIRPGSSSLCGVLNGKLWLSLPGGALGGSIIFCEVLNVLLQRLFALQDKVFFEIPVRVRCDLTNFSEYYKGVWGAIRSVKSFIEFLPFEKTVRFTDDFKGYILLYPNIGKVNANDVLNCKVIVPV